jgi:hypothetical protein
MELVTVSDTLPDKGLPQGWVNPVGVFYNVFQN